MASLKTALALGVALTALLAGSAAQAASASAAVTGAAQNGAGNGFATAEVSTAQGFAQGNGYEFRGGIGVSAFAAANGSVAAFGDGFANLNDSFRVRDTSGLFDLGGTVFQLNIPILATGMVSSGNAALPAFPSVYSIGVGRYDYNWTVGQFSGSGLVNSAKLSNGGSIDTSVGSASEAILLLVHAGDLINLSFAAHATAQARGFPSTPANGTADFGHSLRWGGVIGITALDASGNAIELPDDFALSMISDSSGFDYWNAAGANPFLSGGVPEPASWGLMILGFGGMGAALRRRRPALQPT